MEFGVLFFQYLKNVVPLPLVSMVSDEKSAVIQIIFFWVGNVSFLLDRFQDFLFVSSFLKFSYGISWHRFEFFLFGVCLAS